MANSKEFLVSVGKAIMRDPTTGAGLGYGKFNLESSLTMSTEEAMVRGGVNNPILYVYKHSKKVDVKITDATFSPTIMAMNAGVDVYNGPITVTGDDCLTLSSSGSGTLSQTPTSSTVEVWFEQDGTIQSVTPSGANITVSGGANQKVQVFYDYTTTADRVRIETSAPPKVIDLTLLVEVRDDTNTLTDKLQIRIPRFQVSGNYNLAMGANTVSNQGLEGTALENPASDCTSDSYYADVIWVPQTSAGAASVYALASYPSELTFSVAAGLPANKQINLYGLRGVGYGNVPLTSSASYMVTSGSTTLAANYNVGLHTGLVTAGSAVSAGWNAVVTASYVDATHGLLHDTIVITATA